jgi:hypothetical protein
MSDHDEIDALSADVLSKGWGETKLKTDQRVLARITDGIYREPAAALRELIFNAYDADATNVWIQTDAPRFGEIVVNDDGEGMTLEVLAYVVAHIGGSAKRTSIGSNIGIARKDNPKLSKGGRRMIGKIGIGMFAVAQLTRQFRIVTKPRGEPYRYVVDIQLKTHSEDDLAKINATTKTVFETGDVRIQREDAQDRESHGTQVILMGLKQSSLDLLQSRDRWVRAPVPDSLFDEDALVRPKPRYHIGSVDPESPDTIPDKAELPWNNDDHPDVKFRKLYQSVLDEVQSSGPLPELQNIFDYYLQMLWKLSLAAPVDYVDQHPFAITGQDDVRVFVLSNREKEQAKELTLKAAEDVATAAGLTKPSPSSFKVSIDGVQLLRPIRFRDLPRRSSSRQKQPLLFVAKCKPNLNQIPVDAVGGRELAFEGYLFWSPTVVPKDNNGLILRMGGATGSLFDDTFLKYEVTERTRLGQITGELFFTEGLDAALNIDRESFNYAHPHYQFVMKWVHRALLQLANRSKAIGADLKKQADIVQAGAAQAKLTAVVNEAMGQIPRMRDENPAEVAFVDDSQFQDVKQQRKSGTIVFSRSVLEEIPNAGGKGKNQQSKAAHFEGQLRAVAQILDGYGLLARLSYKQQNELIRAIARVFATEVTDDVR